MTVRRGRADDWSAALCAGGAFGVCAAVAPEATIAARTTPQSFGAIATLPPLALRPTARPMPERASARPLRTAAPTHRRDGPAAAPWWTSVGKHLPWRAPSLHPLATP